MIVDATDAILGRLSTYVAKQAMLGETVHVINSEKAVISGKKGNIFEEYLARKARGIPAHGPFLERKPERIVRRSIRGMLPWDKPRGKEAFRKVRCYSGCPDEFKGKEAVRIDKSNVSKLPNLKYIDIKSISKRLGAKIE